MASRYEVVKNDEGTWNVACLLGDCQFSSFGWSKKKDAVARIAQHITEHDTGVPMPELVDFMAPENSDPGVPHTDQPETVEDDSETA